MIMECCYNSVQFRRYDLCRVKFGVPLDHVCKKDIPGPLLVSIYYTFLFFKSIWLTITMDCPKRQKYS